MNRRAIGVWVMVCVVAGGAARRVEAQEAPAASDQREGDASGGYAVPNSERFRVSLNMAFGYSWDEAENASLGLEAQGRMAWTTVALFGKISDRFSYRLEINPVNETGPLPACGTPTFFYPNEAQHFGPGVRCETDGDKRVDDYKFMALDPISQQGAIRQAYLDYQRQWFGMKIGRFIQPLGFGWEEAGSFNAKDSTHIQRINAEANYGFQLRFVKNRADGSPFAAFYGGAVIGEGNRNHDYNYFYFTDPSFDTNSAGTGIVSGTIAPVKGLEVRGAYKRGFTGSKVEYFPNYFADKHNDFARLLSVSWRPSRYGRVFGEYARYTWGPTKSSALMVGADPAPIIKDGYYVGGEVNYTIAEIGLSANVTREELSRDDSLIKYIAARGLWGVTMGKKERDTVFRLKADIGKHLTAGLYRMWLENPFPVVSGIVEIPGDNLRRGSRRGGLTLLVHLP